MAEDELFDPWTHDYALLGLRLDRIHPGTVDAWIGPPEWRESVLAEEAPEPERLLRDAWSLEERLPDMGYDSTRETYLTLQVAGLRAQAEIATGSEIPFAEQAR